MSGFGMAVEKADGSCVGYGDGFGEADRMSTWRELIREASEDDEIIACTLTDEELDVKFDDGYGSERGKPFTAWSERYVYFPVCYDGSEWVGRAPRFPCGEATGHMGGG